MSDLENGFIEYAVEEYIKRIGEADLRQEFLTDGGRKSLKHYISSKLQGVIFGYLGKTGKMLFFNDSEKTRQASACEDIFKKIAEKLGVSEVAVG
jgi:hypothetical protein